ncbi:Flp pilus assembly protein CpaB [Chungangia koreensis]|uniref:Flp pilus assembly protein CpaB n=2 Tax=Chungangia koreensis TaxID=752657 RepID=A0ABV8X638_9LACT
MRSRTLFILAILMGLITTLMFVFSLRPNDEPQEVIEMKNVIAAIQPISENQLITEDMIEVKELPANIVHTASLQTKEEVVGKVASTKIETGEVILKHHIQSVEDEKSSVAKKIKDGYRGVSIGVNIVQSVSNLVEPEDEVDVIYTLRKGSSGQEVVNSDILFTGVKVLAIGTRMTVPTENEEVVEYATVTLELKPEDAVKLVNALETGSLHLTLHSRIISE